MTIAEKFAKAERIQAKLIAEYEKEKDFAEEATDLLMEKAAHHMEADAEVIKAAEDHLVKRLKALQTYFDLSDEELQSMTTDERADTIRQHRLISEALVAFRQAQARAEKGGE